jgi:hypothetical protein
MKMHLYVIEERRTGTKVGQLACSGDLRGKAGGKASTREPRLVTCELCRKSKRFRAYVAGWDACQDILRQRVLEMLRLQESK